MPICPECQSTKIWKDGLRHIQGSACTWHLQKMGKSEATIRTYTKYLKNIIKQGGELNDPESIKSVIATHFKDRNTKRLAVFAYDSYIKFKGGQWTKPNYKQEHKQKFIPNDEELQLAMNSGTKESIIFSKFLYKTGARLNEAQRLEWTDINDKKNQVTVKASKNGKSRILDVSENLIHLLLSLPEKSDLVFVKYSGNRSASFHNRMVKLPMKHNNPRLKKSAYTPSGTAKLSENITRQGMCFMLWRFSVTETLTQPMVTLNSIIKYTRLSNKSSICQRLRQPKMNAVN